MVKIFRGVESRNIKVIESLDTNLIGEGTLSSRYLINIEGANYFAKVFRPGENSFGRSSREMIKNEIAVLDYIYSNSASAPAQDLLRYRGYAEVGDVTTLLFEDQVTWRSGATLEKRLNVQSERIKTQEEVPTTEEVLNLKRSVEATNYQSYEVGDVIDIVRQIADQIGQYHSLRGDKCAGIIHMDITPKNIIIVDDIDTRKKKAIVIDFGIARENGEAIDHLFNKSSLSDGRGGDYYLSQKGIFNLVYSSIDSRQQSTANPSLDTYNIVNVLCLMLTGRLIEYWETEAKKTCDPLFDDNLFDDDPEIITEMMNGEIADVIEKRCKSLNLASEVKLTLINELSRIITYGRKANQNQQTTDQKGTISTSSVRADYSTCAELIEELDALGIKPILKEPITISLPLDIPPVFRNYKLSAPLGLAQSLEPEWTRLARKALSFEDDSNIPLGPDFKPLEEAISRSISFHHAAPTFTTEMQKDNPTSWKRRFKYGGIAVGSLCATLLGGYLGYLLTSPQDVHTTRKTILKTIEKQQTTFAGTPYEDIQAKPTQTRPIQTNDVPVNPKNIPSTSSWIDLSSSTENSGFMQNITTAIKQENLDDVVRHTQYFCATGSLYSGSLLQPNDPNNWGRVFDTLSWDVDKTHSRYADLRAHYIHMMKSRGTKIIDCRPEPVPNVTNTSGITQPSVVPAIEQNQQYSITKPE